jgi:hypothetical protein
MIQLAENFNFPESRLLPLHIHQLETVVYFDGDSFPSGLMQGLLDYGICTVADLLAKLVVRDFRAPGGSEFSETHHVVALVVGKGAKYPRGLGDRPRVSGVSHLLCLPEGLFIFLELSGEGVFLFL